MSLYKIVILRTAGPKTNLISGFDPKLWEVGSSDGSAYFGELINLVPIGWHKACIAYRLWTENCKRLPFSAQKKHNLCFKYAGEIWIKVLFSFALLTGHFLFPRTNSPMGSVSLIKLNSARYYSVNINTSVKIYLFTFYFSNFHLQPRESAFESVLNYITLDI